VILLMIKVAPAAFRDLPVNQGASEVGDEVGEQRSARRSAHAAETSKTGRAPAAS
jgi:hypothetical protein